MLQCRAVEVGKNGTRLIRVRPVHAIWDEENMGPGIRAVRDQDQVVRMMGGTRCHVRYKGGLGWYETEYRVVRTASTSRRIQTALP